MATPEIEVQQMPGLRLALESRGHVDGCPGDADCACGMAALYATVVAGLRAANSELPEET